MHVFDGQTDRIIIARPRLHSMQRGKNSNRWHQCVYHQPRRRSRTVLPDCFQYFNWDIYLASIFLRADLESVVDEEKCGSERSYGNELTLSRCDEVR